MSDATPVTYWQLRTLRLPVRPVPLLMGILNVTPDSFSDGGRFLDPQQAVDQGLGLAAQGADILDVGGESTRPYAAPVPVDEERRRVLPVIEKLKAATSVPISIDTSKADIAQEALDRGVEIVNDVTGLRGDPRMLAVVREAGAGICVMHMRGTPATMQDAPHYDDVIAEVADHLRAQRDLLRAHGVQQDRICIDPGIGFGKTTAHNLALLAHVRDLTALGCPVLIGHSRKGFIGRVLGDEHADRTAGTIGVALAVATQGAAVLRVHDVQPVRHALQLFAACGGLDTNGETVQ